MSTTTVKTFEEKIKEMKKEELIKNLLNAKKIINSLKTYQNAQKRISGYLQDRQTYEEKQLDNSKQQTFNTANFIKEIILTAFDRGQNMVYLSDIDLLLFDTQKYFYKDEKNKIFYQIDYVKKAINFKVNLEKFTEQEIEYINRMYSLNIPVSTCQHKQTELNEQEKALELFFSE